MLGTRTVGVLPERCRRGRLHFLRCGARLLSCRTVLYTLAMMCPTWPGKRARQLTPTEPMVFLFNGANP